MSSALDGRPIVAAIVADRARAISTDPGARWSSWLRTVRSTTSRISDRFDNMAVLAGGIANVPAYASIDWMTVRDDAPAAVREAATAELRALVEKRRRTGDCVLIVPVLLSFGGIEHGMRKRLDGLDYMMAPGDHA